MNKEQALKKLAELSWELEDDLPEAINTDPAFETMTRECWACPSIFTGRMANGAYYRLRFRRDTLCIGFDWRDFNADDFYPATSYQFTAEDLTGDDLNGLMDWDEAKELIKTYYDKWVEGGCEI